MKAMKFKADWCGPCHAYASIFEEAVADAGIEHEEIDVDQSPEIAAQFGVRNIPMTLLMCGDKVVKRYPGVVEYNDLMAGIKKVGEACSQ